ncbi:MAG: hypothetical protein JNG84_09145 [Archangium sp.]|nr:hypothetical protein [Archangium sp.]
MRTPLLVCLTLFSACGSFTGDKGTLFDSSLTNAYSGWTPKTPLAPGASLTITPFNRRDSGVEAFSDGGAVELSRSADGGIRILARGTGDARLTWTEAPAGVVFDTFAVTVREPVHMRVSELFAHRGRAVTDAADGGPLGDTSATSPLFIAPGAPYLLAVELLAADDRWVAHSADLLALDSDSGAAFLDDGYAIVAIDGGTHHFALSLFDGGLHTDVTAIATEASAVAAVALDVSVIISSDENEPAALVLALATATLDGGARLHQAPVTFETSPNLSPIDVQGQLRWTYPRRDVATFQVARDGGTAFPDGGGTTYVGTVTAHVGSASTTAQVRIDVPRLSDDAGTDAGVEEPDGGVVPQPTTPPCGCDASPAAGLLLGLVAFGPALRRRQPFARAKKSSPLPNAGCSAAPSAASEVGERETVDLPT